MGSMIQSQDGNVKRNFMLINGAGSTLINPVVASLVVPFRAVFQDYSKIQSFSAYVDNTAISMTQDSNDSRIFYKNLTIGSSPFSSLAGKHTFEISMVSTSGKTTKFSQVFYSQSLGNDAIQLWDANNQAWTNVNTNALPSSIPTVSQHCPIRFFPTFLNEHGIKTFGGVKYVSVLDASLTDEDDIGLDMYVFRQKEKEIRHFCDIYLIKNLTGQIETHYIKFILKAEKGIPGITIPVTVKTTACFGFPVYTPSQLS